MKNQICTILGGGGFIGRYLVRNLTKKNYRCIITTRKAFQKGSLKTQATPGAIELLDWNPNNFSDLKEAIKDSDVVVNLIGILFENRKQKFYNIHSKIPEAVSKICSESDVKKFIHVSAIGANDKSKSLYQKSKFLGEQKAQENFKKTVIIRPSVVCGPEDNFTNLFSNDFAISEVMSSFILIIFIYKFKYHEKSNLHNPRWWGLYRKISCSKFDQEKL